MVFLLCVQLRESVIAHLSREYAVFVDEHKPSNSESEMFYLTLIPDLTPESTSKPFDPVSDSMRLKILEIWLWASFIWISFLWRRFFQQNLLKSITSFQNFSLQTCDYKLLPEARWWIRKSRCEWKYAIVIFETLRNTAKYGEIPCAKLFPQVPASAEKPCNKNFLHWGSFR